VLWILFRNIVSVLVTMMMMRRLSIIVLDLSTKQFLLVLSVIVVVAMVFVRVLAFPRRRE
jgi:hypothetical protein